METIETEQSIWNKTNSELTAGDSLKITLGVAVAVATLPYAIKGVVAGVTSLKAKYQEHKLAKQVAKEIDEQ